MTKYFSMLLLSGAATVFSGIGHTEAPPNDVAPTVLQLPPEIRKALVDEMAALQPAMSRLAEAIPQGDWALVAQTAAAMRDGFILKKALTSAELETLQNSLPERFLVMDTGFHHYADKLATAAQKQDGELVPFYFYKMIETCVACHSEYAGGRFTGYRKPAVSEHHHH